MRRRSKETERRYPERQAAVAEARARDKECVCSAWSTVPCSPGPLEPDEPKRRSQGADIYDKDQIRMICHIDHQLKDNIMRKGAKILGLNGEEAQEMEMFEFYYETPEGDWDAYEASWRRAWDAEKRYMQGGPKPPVRYKPKRPPTVPPIDPPK